MSKMNEKLAKLLLIAGGTAVGIFLLAKYRKDILRKLKLAKNAVFMNFQQSFSIEVINNDKECQDFMKRFKSHFEDFPVCGFDCEWVTINNERRKVALVQLCSPQGLCGLFRVFKYSKMPLELRTFLEDPDIIKVGVAPHGDAQLLLEDYAMKVNGTFDLRFLALLAQHKAGGLNNLSKSVLSIELDKSWRLRCSDWEIETMSKQQIDYAAKDAYVAVEIFRKLYKMIRQDAMDPESIVRFCDNYTDITFKNKMAQMNLDSSHSEMLLQKNNWRNKPMSRSYTTRKTPLYHNCMLEAPDGEMLCTVDRKKAEWYVKNGLGTEVSVEPVYTVRLNFEPAGRARGEVGEYYRCARENRCVVCGKTEDLIRKNVVPHEYRKFFPFIMKAKVSHDIVLLCIRCHQQSNISDLKTRQKLQDLCDAPLANSHPDDVKAGKKLNRVKRLARALVLETKIPEDRREEMKQELKALYPGNDLDEEFLQDLMKQQPEVLNSNPSHGETVVQKYKETVGLVELEKLWRLHFINTMEPKFMPELWDINHNGNRLEIRASEGRVDEEDLKLAGIDAVIVPKVAAQPKVVVTSAEDKTDSYSEQTNIEDEAAVDSSSEWEFRSAAGSINLSANTDKTLTEDNYFSDDASWRSFYETVASGSSTIDDFQSFASSLKSKRTMYDSDHSGSTLSTPNFSDGSDTEVDDDENENVGKMEL